jgi:hypothetical protein
MKTRAISDTCGEVRNSIRGIQVSYIAILLGFLRGTFDAMEF